MNLNVTKILTITLVEDFQNSERIVVDMSNRILSIFAVIDDTGFSGDVKTIPLKREDIGNKIGDVYTVLQNVSETDVLKSAREILNILGIDTRATIGSVVLSLHFNDLSVILDLEHRSVDVFYEYDDGKGRGMRLELLRTFDVKSPDAWSDLVSRAINTKSHEDFMDLVQYILNYL